MFTGGSDLETVQGESFKKRIDTGGSDSNVLILRAQIWILYKENAQGHVFILESQIWRSYQGNPEEIVLMLEAQICRLCKVIVAVETHTDWIMYDVSLVVSQPASGHLGRLGPSQAVSCHPSVPGRVGPSQAVTGRVGPS